MTAKVAVIGCGSIGASWAALFLAHGFSVTAYDINASAESFVRNFVREALPTLAALGEMGQSPRANEDDIKFTTNLNEALEGADFVQENGPEKLQLKQTLFGEITSMVRHDTILATSSSGLTCSSIQEGMSPSSHPERLIVGHPFNPPHLIPLVEVVGGSKTTPEVISKAMEFYSKAGRKPINIQKEVSGHVANRLQSALAREMMHLISEDVCTVKDLDDAMSYGPGLRWGVMGPSKLFHLGGGPGGIEHMSQHLLAPLMSWYTKEDPIVDEALRQKWVKGTLEAVDGCTYQDLAKQRDEELVALLKTRKAWDNYAYLQFKYYFFSRDVPNSIHIRHIQTSYSYLVTRLRSQQEHSLLDHTRNNTPNMPGQLLTQRLYFLDIAIHTPKPLSGRIMTCRPDGSDLEPLVGSLHEMPDGIVVDDDAGHIYWTNMGPEFSTDSGSISRCNIDGSNVTTIVPHGITHTPKQITLAKNAQKLYWCDREGMRIMRCNLDGSEVEVLLRTKDDVDRHEMEKWCVGITLDEQRGHIYWSQKGPAKGRKGRIFRAPIPPPKANGQSTRYTIQEKDIEVLFEGLPEPIDLELDEATQTLYWTDRGDPPEGNSVNRAQVSPELRGSGYKKEILATRLHEAIGIALDVEHNRVFATDLAGGLYSIDTGKTKGSKYVLFPELGDITGIALAHVP
ncbi:hypothetical protein DM02DRAFT_554077 [Periconia macrospinosa]|uniref:3-hydroxyacyl-CoA dehydrogenase n=1 Tax=Periconia macrospinosa TaxID=97972 RepID=A0A2V1E7W6_9PLEO|nr:hypothetical protein DM02DRAFT_554077 [Periconia macrospinosa]